MRYGHGNWGYLLSRVNTKGSHTTVADDRNSTPRLLMPIVTHPSSHARRRGPVVVHRRRDPSSSAFVVHGHRALLTHSSQHTVVVVRPSSYTRPSARHRASDVVACRRARRARVRVIYFAAHAVGHHHRTPELPGLSSCLSLRADCFCIGEVQEFRDVTNAFPHGSVLIGLCILAARIT